MVCMTYFDLLTKDTYYVLSCASASKIPIDVLVYAQLNLAAYKSIVTF